MADIEKKIPFNEQEIERSFTEERENYFTVPSCFFMGSMTNEQTVNLMLRDPVVQGHIQSLKSCMRVVNLGIFVKIGLLGKIGLFNPVDIRYSPKGYLSTREYAKIGKDIYNMEVRPDDIFVVTFPKSGTTWTQELVWLISNGYDFERAKKSPLAARFPALDLPIFFTPQILEKLTAGKKLEDTENPLPVPSIDELADWPSPRYIKTHQPLSLLPPKLLDTCKVVYVARDPRDVGVSFYHYHKLVRSIADDKDFKTYWNFFIRDLIEYTPYFSHVKEAWEARNHPNMLFLFYEELSQDLAACACRVAKFLGKEVKIELLGELCDHLHIENFRKNKAVNFEGLRDLGFFKDNESFIRKGKVGGWRDYFDDAMNQEAARWIEENLLDTDLRFPQQ